MQRRDEAQQAVSELPDVRAELRCPQKELTGERDTAEKEERPLRQQAGGTRSRAERLAALEKQTAPQERLDGQLISLNTSLELHKAAAERIKSARGKARGDRNAASGRAARLAQALSELRSGHADAEALTVIVARDGDPIRPGDAQAARPFAKVNKPMFLRLARDIARSLGVQLVPLTGIRDLGALTVFPRSSSFGFPGGRQPTPSSRLALTTNESSN
jgi:hypothetical protein